MDLADLASSSPPTLLSRMTHSVLSFYVLPPERSVKTSHHSGLGSVDTLSGGAPARLGPALATPSLTQVHVLTPSPLSQGSSMGLSAGLLVAGLLPHWCADSRRPGESVLFTEAGSSCRPCLAHSRYSKNICLMNGGVFTGPMLE